MRCLEKIIQGLRRPWGCRWWVPVLVTGVVLLVGPAAADIYRYVDDEGVIHYTDDIDRVPAKYKDLVQQQKTVRREGSSKPSPGQPEPPADESAPGGPAGTTEPREGPTEEIPETDAETEEAPETETEEMPESETEEGAGAETPESSSEAEEGAGEEAGSGDSAAIKHQLEQERQSLLRQKEALANNQTYQKRKIKRRYKNRPHIQELMETESRIDERLAEIEKALQKTD